MNTTEQELKEILDYQIETIIKNGTTYEFQIIDSPSIIIDGKSFLAYTHTIHRIREHQLTSRFNSIREEFENRNEYEMVDLILTSMEFILSFLEEHKGKKVFVMGDSGSNQVGPFMRSKTIRVIVV